MATKTYSMKLDLPEDVKTFFSGLDGQTRICGISDEGTTVAVQFEMEETLDAYDLAFRAAEIAHEAGRYVGETLTFARPKEVR